MVGFELSRRVENKEVIENATLTTRSKLQIHSLLERNWNTGSYSPRNKKLRQGGGPMSIIDNFKDILKVAESVNNLDLYKKLTDLRSSVFALEEKTGP